MLGLALSQAGTEFVLAQDCGLTELAQPPSRSRAEGAAVLTGGCSQPVVLSQAAEAATSLLLSLF